jgi:hypothetical protein
MTLKKCLAIMFVLSVFCLAYPMISKAGCTKFCRIIPNAHLTFAMIPKNTSYVTDQRRGYVLLAEIKAEGHYGGGCRTSVGRQKARKRACKAAKNLAKQAYAGKPHEWKKYICNVKAGATGKYSLLLFRGSGGKIHITPLDEVKWIKVNRIDFKVLAQDGTTRSVRKKGEFTIKGDGKKFACKNGKPAPVR